MLYLYQTTYSLIEKITAKEVAYHGRNIKVHSLFQYLFTFGKYKAFIVYRFYYGRICDIRFLVRNLKLDLM